MYRYLILLSLMLTACASMIIVRSHPEITACGAALGVRIEGYYAGCTNVTVIEVTRQSNGTYIGKGECQIIPRLP
jgi:hypothetical protein